jgi:Domain of unknown function (DUF4349)
MIGVLVFLLSLLGMALSGGSGEFASAEVAGVPAMPQRHAGAPMMKMAASRSAPMPADVMMDEGVPAMAPAPEMAAGQASAGGAGASFGSFAAHAMPAADGQVDNSFAPLFGEKVLIKEAHMSAETKELDKAVSLVLKLLGGIKGEVEHTNVNHAPPAEEGEDGVVNPYQWRPQSTADIRAKVPAKALDSFLDQLRAALTTTPLGDSQSVAKILSENQNARDASAEYVDAATRERVEMASLETMKQLLERAASVRDVLAIRQEMMSITSRVESARAQRKSLESRSAMSYISINLQTPQWKPPKPKPFPGWSVSRTAGQALKSLILVSQGVVDMAIFAAVFALPTLAALVVGFYVLRLLLRLLVPLEVRQKIVGGWRGGFLAPAAMAAAAVSGSGDGPNTTANGGGRRTE